MRFHDRTDAGKALARGLERYEGDGDTLVVALPRGGVVVAGEVAKALRLPLDIIVPRKIAAPSDPEYALGAFVETGDPVWGPDGEPHGAWLRDVLDEERREAARRLALYRQGRPERSFGGKAVIVVDDGLATGLTMEASLVALRSMGAKTIVMAIPHGAKDSVERLKPLCDSQVALATPEYYGAVGELYDVFPQVTDDEVISIMRNADI